MKFIILDGKQYLWRDLLKLPREQRRKHDRRNRHFLNSKKTAGRRHSARHLRGMKNRCSLNNNESHYGGTFVSDPHSLVACHFLFYDLSWLRSVASFNHPVLFKNIWRFHEFRRLPVKRIRR